MKRESLGNAVLSVLVASFVVCLSTGGAALAANMIANESVIIAHLEQSENINLPITVATRSSPPALNTTFSLTYGSGLAGNTAARNAFDMAAARWSAVLRDPVTLNLALDYQSLGTGILGQSSSTFLSGGYDVVRNLVAGGQDSGSAAEALLPGLPTSAQFQARLPTGFALDGQMALTQANYLALGGSRITDSDGAITFSSNFSWDFDPSDGITPGTYDFVGVATHEIGHALGFSSETDYVDTVLHAGSTSNQIEPRILDLFRFQTSDLGSGFDFANTPRNLTPGGSHSFYYGAGSVPMATGLYNGDGYQASHWKEGLGLGIMDPAAAAGELLQIGPNDLVALDLIGWNVVPEPASVLLLALGFLARFTRRGQSVSGN